MKNMNLPNKLTLGRICMIPLCVLFIALGWYFVAAVVFALAAATDWLDGYLARKHNLVTTFGKFADPVADKLLVLTAIAMLVEKGMLPGWALCVLLIRELAVDGLRLVAAGKNIVVAASWWGKIKTNLQIFCVLSALLSLPGWITWTLTVLMVIATIGSGLDYFNGLKHVFTEDAM